MPTPDSLTTSRHRDLDLCVVAGEWPDDLHGEVLFSAPMISGRAPYGLFDAGCVLRLSLRPGRLGAADDRFAWRARPIETPGHLLQMADPESFVANAVGFHSPYGPLNAANTAPLPWGERLFVTWDAGRPVELDPVTLEFVAEVGSIESWGASALFGDTVLPTLLTSAHPAVDPDRGGMWTTKLEPTSGSGFALAPSVVWWTPDRTEVSVWPLHGIEFHGSTHTVSQTRDWLIIADSGNFRADLGEILGAERTVTVDPDAPVWLVRKDQILSTRPGTPVTPVCFRVAPPSGHFYARYDDAEGIQVVWEGMDLVDLGMYIRAGDVDLTGRPVNPATVGLYNMAMAPSTITELVFDPVGGRVEHRASVREAWSMNLQLSAMDWSREGLMSPDLHHVDFQGCHPERITARAADLYADRFDRSEVESETPGCLVSFDRGSLAVHARWEYSDLGDLVTSPTFVPRDAGAEGASTPAASIRPGGGDGYVVQPVFNDDGFRVELFDAADVGAGPVAVLRSPGRECVPLMLHSAWRPEPTGLVDAPRVRFREEASSARVAGLDPARRGVVEGVAAAIDQSPR